MADFVFNNVKGEVKTLAALSAASDALLFILLETSGIEADDVLNNADDVAALVSGATNEQTNQTRKSVTTAPATVDDTNNRVDIDVADQTWTALGGNAISDLVIAWDGDTGTGTDANVRPLTQHDFTITPDGSDVTAQIATAGFFRAQ